MINRKLYLKQIQAPERTDINEVAFKVTKTVDSGTAYEIGAILSATEVDRLSANNKYTVTIT